jgi:hypothetical protein
MTPALIPFISGMITAGYALAGLFFLRFWRRTHEDLFAAFAGAFWLMALNQGLIALLQPDEEHRGWFYLLRLAAFLLIITAILRKNLDGRR